MAPAEEAAQIKRALSTPQRWPTSGKLKRVDVQRWATSGSSIAPATASPGVTVESVISRFAPGAALTADTTLNELGLTSLTQIELLMALEEAFDVTVEETELEDITTIGQAFDLISSKL